MARGGWAEDARRPARRGPFRDYSMMCVDVSHLWVYLPLAVSAAVNDGSCRSKALPKTPMVDCGLSGISAILIKASQLLKSPPAIHVGFSLSSRPTNDAASTKDAFR